MIATMIRPRLGRPRAKDRPPGATRASLLTAAADIFAERGYEGAGVDAIAKRAGVTGGALYKHFAGKAELLLAVVEQAVHALPISERLASDERPTARFFAELVSSYTHPEMRRVRRLAIEIHAAAAREPDAAMLLLEFNRRIHQVIAERLRAGVLRDGAARREDAGHLASILLVLVMGAVHLDTLEPDRLGDSAFRGSLERAVARLLGAAS